MTRGTTVSIESLLSKESLERVWRIMRKQFREELVRDPLDHLAYEAHLQHNLKYLAYRLRNGRFVTSGVTIVRSAKRDGLTRPLAYLEIEDQLVYKAICDGLGDELLKGFPPWVNFSRSRLVRRDADPNGGQVHHGEYDTWFDAWLRHSRVLANLVVVESACNFIVEADITDFFSSINLSLLRDHILANTSASAELVNLLFSILHALIPRPGYSIAHNIGLPQENFDASRTLAHAFLKPLDSVLEPLGREGRYARWVDDIRLAVRDPNEGKAHLSRIQLCLESLGLALNAGKTRIVTKDQARRELYLELNSYLDYVHKVGRKEGPHVSEFHQRLQDFLLMEPQGGWERVLRRFYTEARRIGSAALENYAWKHIVDFPQSAPAILKYLNGRPYKDHLLDGLWGYLRSGANLYENVEILIYEFLLQWHLPQSKARDVARAALDHFFGRNEFRVPLSRDYVRGLIALLVFKCGGYDELQQIRDYFEGSSDRHFVRYAYMVLMATSSFRGTARSKALSFEDPTLRRLASFVEELLDDPSQYEGLIKNYVSPRLLKLPDRYAIQSRALPLIRLCGEHTEFRVSRWSQMVDHAIRLLRDRTQPEWRDEVAISWLEQERQRA